MEFLVKNKKPAIRKAPGRYRSFPTLVRLPDGELLMQYRDGRAQPGTFSHGDQGDLCLVYTQQGKWSEPRTLYTHAGHLEEMGGDMSILKDGTIILFSRQWDDKANCTHQTYAAIRPDQGNTFTDRQPVRFPEFPQSWVPYGKVIELPDGRLLLGAYGKQEGDTGFSAGLVTSSDQGRSWEFYSWIAIQNSVPGKQFMEPFSFFIHKGILITLLRTNGQFYQTQSQDSGMTWTVPVPAFAGMAAAGIVLSDGKLLVTYRGIHSDNDLPREKKIALPRKGRLYCARVSDDEGRTWGAEIELDTRTAGQVGSYGMGDAIELPDNSIRVVYYTSDKDQSPWIEECLLVPR
jgi:hypothetical protein